MPQPWWLPEGPLGTVHRYRLLDRCPGSTQRGSLPQAGSQGQGWAERLRAAAWHAWTTPIFGDAPTTNTPPLEGPALGAAAAAAGTAEAAAGAAPNLAASAPCKSLAERDPLCVLEDIYRSGSDTPYETSAPGSPHTVVSAQPSGQLPTGDAAGAQEPAAEQPAPWPAPRPGLCEASCEPAQESSAAGPALTARSKAQPATAAPRDTADLQLRPPADEPAGAGPLKPPRPASVPASWLLHPAPAPLPMPPTNHKLSPQPSPALKVRCGRSQHSS